MTASMAKFIVLILAAATMSAAAGADEIVTPKAQAPQALMSKGNTDGKRPSAAANTASKVHRPRASNSGAENKGTTGNSESLRTKYTFHPIDIPGAKKKNKGATDDWNVGH